jgi:Family of unknown function (DUF6152)
MSKVKFSGRCASILFLVSLPLLAHHPFSSEFDANKPMTLTGTVTKVDWSGPHAYIYVNAMNENGKTEEWKLETASPEYLTTHGMKEGTFKAGEKVTVNAYRATSEQNVASARVVTTGNGKKMQVADPSEDGGPAK